MTTLAALAQRLRDEATTEAKISQTCSDSQEAAMRLTVGAKLLHLAGQLDAEIAYPEPDGLRRLSSTEWFVQSRTQRGVWWHVTSDGNGLHCGCPHGSVVEERFAGETKEARFCWHMQIAVEFEINRDRTLYGRATPEAHVSALVD